jgi:histone acetyltransferase HTATIP
MNEHSSISWPLQSFAISNDFKSPNPAQLLLDRANAEFGLVYPAGPGIIMMAQFPDTNEPVFFQVSKARAVCTRFNATCKKVCVLMQHLQIDLHFTSIADAVEFLDTLRRIATKIGNIHFEVHEAASYVSSPLSIFT